MKNNFATRSVSISFAALLIALPFALGACSHGAKNDTVDVTEAPLAAKDGQAQKCYQIALAQGKSGEPAAEGEMTFSLNITPAGSVTHVSTINSTMNSKKLEDCISNVLRNIKFDKEPSGRVTQLTRTYHFNASTFNMPTAGSK